MKLLQIEYIFYRNCVYNLWVEKHYIKNQNSKLQDSVSDIGTSHFVWLVSQFLGNFLREMKLFTFIRKPFGILGIVEQKQSPHFQFNRQICLSISFLTIYTTWSWIYFFIEASSFSEYADSLYSSWSMSFILFTGLIMIIHSTDIFDLLQDFETAVQRREFLTFSCISKGNSTY